MSTQIKRPLRLPKVPVKKAKSPLSHLVGSYWEMCIRDRNEEPIYRCAVKWGTKDSLTGETIREGDTILVQGVLQEDGSIANPYIHIEHEDN